LKTIATSSADLLVSLKHVDSIACLPAYVSVLVVLAAAEWQRSRAANSGLSKTPSGLWSKIFGFGKSTS
jgi:hypothetical protein